MEQDVKSTSLLGIIAILFIVSASGIFWAVTSTERSVGFLFAYVAGLVIAITPCCLPLFFFITSLAIKQKRHTDAILVSLFFGAGIAFVAAILGLALAFTGQVIGLSQVSGIVFAIGGAIGYLYAMSELFGFHIPVLGVKMPQIMQGRGRYAMVFYSGVLLGVGDIGCPNPFRYVLFSFITTTGDLLTGSSLGLLYGLGAITPLILVAFLALLGINLTSAITKHTEKIEKIINLSFVPLGAFLVTFGIFGEQWYESTPIHDVWEGVLLQFNLISPHEHFGEGGVWNMLGNVVLLLMLVVPFVIYFTRRNSNLIKIDSGK